MAEKLLFDPFVDMKDFHQHPANFNPHQLPLMSSIWPSVLIASIYLLMLRLGPGWVNFGRLIDASTDFVFQFDEASPTVQFENIPGSLQHFSSVLVSLLSGECFSHWISMGLSMDLLHDRLWEHESCEASLLLVHSQRDRVNRDDLLRSEEKVSTNVFPPHLSPRVDLFVCIFRSNARWKWVNLGPDHRRMTHKSFLDGMLMTTYTLNMIVHSIMYSYYFASIYIKDFDKVISLKKSITIMQMVCRNSNF